MKKELIGAVFAGLFVVATGPAQATALVFLDAWQIDTSAVGGVLTTDIGELALSGGVASVDVQVNGDGNPFAGARFTEFGAMYSIAYIPENAPGPNDFGFPVAFGPDIHYSLEFSGLNGYVSSYNGATGAMEHVFDGLGPGGYINFNLSTDGGMTFLTIASLDTPTGGGDLDDFFGVSGINGISSLDMLVASSIAGLLRDSGGNPLDAFIPPDELFVNVRTNNEIAMPPGDVFECEIDGDPKASDSCRNLLVLSNGSANLAIQVPEPATMSLLGVGLMASCFAGFRRRSS
jgi:hypothetical protein